MESIQPRMGNSQGGTVMTVSGRNFASTNALRCRVGTVETSGVWRGSHQVECVSPAMQPSPPNSRRGHPVQISSNQKDFTSSEVKFVYQEMSGVDAAFPAQLPSAGGAEVAIHLPLAHPMETPKCMFGDAESPGVLSADYVTCISPSIQAGFHSVYVARNGQDFERLPVAASESNAVFVEVKPAVEVHIVYPEVAFNGGGSVVQITGRHFVFDDVQCKFGWVGVTAFVVSSALIHCEVPAVESGAYALEVTQPGSTAAEPLVRPNFIFDEMPRVTGVAPSRGTVNGGNTVIAAGYFFSEMHEMACRFGTIGPVSGEWIAQDEFRCTAPAHAPEVVIFDIGIENDYQTYDDPNDREVLYEYVVTPSLTTVTDNNDGTVTVIGAGFHPGEKVYCNLGNNLGFVPGTVQDSNTILCTVPNSGDGMEDIDEANTVITDEFGNSLLSPADPDDKDEDFLQKLPSQIDTVGPTSGPTFGGTFVIVQGINFTPQTLCKFGYHPATVAIFVSSTQIMCESPPHASGLGLTVEVSTNLGMNWTGAGYMFAYESTAQLDYVAPRQGSVFGGSLLKLTGSGMRNTESLSCRVGTISHIASRWLSSSATSCQVPAHREGPVPLGLHSNAADYDMHDVSFTYTPPPNITSIYPTVGVVRGGTRVTVDGVNFPSSGRAMCKFGSIPVAALSRTANQIVCAAPSMRAGMATMEVSINKQDFTITGTQFQFVVPPTVLSINPKSGSARGGTIIAVNGDHFNTEGDFDEGTNCVFSNFTSDGSSDTTYVVSSRLLKCEAPASDLGKSNLELSVNGFDTTIDMQAFRFAQSPEVEGLYPLAGSEQGGGILVMHGSYLGFVDSADVMCRVGTISGVHASHVSTDEISCLMPAHAPGNVPVEITLNRFDHTFNEAAYHYEAMITTLGPIPTRVLAEGGGEITLSLWPSEDTDMSLVCIVDTFPVPASKLSAGTFLCMTPPRAPGFVALDMAIEDSDILSLHPTVLEYQVIPTVTGLNPTIGIDSGVSVIKVGGRHLVGNEAFCHVGYDSQVQAEIISSVLVKCEAPAHEPGRVVIEISTSDHGEQFSHNDIIYEYIEEGAVVAIVPKRRISKRRHCGKASYEQS